MDYCQCGSIKNDNGTCTNVRCMNYLTAERKKGWLIGLVWIEFDIPVTYVEAKKRCEISEVGEEDFEW